MWSVYLSLTPTAALFSATLLLIVMLPGANNNNNLKIIWSEDDCSQQPLIVSITHYNAKRQSLFVVLASHTIRRSEWWVGVVVIIIMGYFSYLCKRSTFWRLSFNYLVVCYSSFCGHYWSFRVLFISCDLKKKNIPQNLFPREPHAYHSPLHNILPGTWIFYITFVCDVYWVLLCYMWLIIVCFMCPWY